MAIKQEATIEDLYKVPGKAEIVNGEIVLMPPTGESPSSAGLRISHNLLNYQDRTGMGRAYADNATFVVNLPHRKSFSPDAAFVRGRKNPGVNLELIEVAPTFTAEVRSKGDYGPKAEQGIFAKRSDYFEAGTEVVWDVDLRSEDVVRVYRKDNPDHPTIYRRGEMAEAEPAVPGWTMPVDDLFL